MLLHVFRVFLSASLSAISSAISSAILLVMLLLPSLAIAQGDLQLITTHEVIRLSPQLKVFRETNNPLGLFDVKEKLNECGDVVATQTMAFLIRVCGYTPLLAMLPRTKDG
jgi:hypothetical protein